MALVSHGLLMLALLREQPLTLTGIYQRLHIKHKNSFYYQRDQLLKQGLIRMDGLVLLLTPAGRTVVDAVASLDPDCLREWTTTK